MKRIDGYLSRVAQTRLDPSSLVYEDSELQGRWFLTRAKQEALCLGDNFGLSKQSLLALINASKTRDIKNG